MRSLKYWTALLFSIAIIFAVHGAVNNPTVVQSGTPNVIVTGGNKVSTTAPINAQTGTTYTVLTGDNTKLVTFSNTGAVAVTLPQAGSAGFASGWSACFVNLSTGLVTITTTTSTINGAGQTAKLPQGASGCLASDGTNWSGTLALLQNPGTSGGVPYYAATNEVLSSAALTANLPVIGGGAGASPTVGSRSGNTTEYVTATGALTSGHCAQWDASGNATDSGGACAGGGSATLVAPQGRLTLVTGTPVMTSDQTAKGTIYYDCYAGNQVPYYTGSADAVDTIASCEVSLTMVSAASAGQVTSGGVFDVWWVHGGANRICIGLSTAVGGGGGWASDTGGSNTARGTGFTQVHNTRGYWTNVNAIANCFNGATNYGSVAADQATYLGSFYSTAAGQTGVAQNPAGASGGTNCVLGLWNAYNRVQVSCTNTDSTTSWPNASASWGPSHGSNSNRVSWIDGLQQSNAAAMLHGVADNSGGSASADPEIGIALDGTGTPQVASVIYTNTADYHIPLSVSTSVPPKLGLHFFQDVESAGAAQTVSFSGVDGAGVVNRALVVSLMM